MTWDADQKSLIQRLVESGYESPLLDRLRPRYEMFEARESLQQEILREMASALGRAEDKVNLALLELELLGRACDESPGDGAKIEAFNAKREHALRVRHDLVIHRDALGLRRDPQMETRYPIPPRRRPA